MNLPAVRHKPTEPVSGSGEDNAGLGVE